MIGEGKGMAVEFTAEVRQDDDGMFWAEIKELPGCFASGETVAELIEAAQDAIALYLSDSDAPGGASQEAPTPEFASFGMRVTQLA
jgi:predicted RNase H-like HicB family nuclease